MNAIRSLLYVVFSVVAIVFVLQNTWMTETRTSSLDLYVAPAVQSQALPIWVYIVGAFLAGYLIAWVVGRGDILALKWRLRRARREAAVKPPVQQA
jgi:uncharacterized integral membrane protein